MIPGEGVHGKRIRKNMTAENSMRIFTEGHAIVLPPNKSLRETGEDIGEECNP